MTMILALITLTLGALLIAPTLSYAATAIKSTSIHKERTKEIYAADAGVEKALWQVTDGGLTMAEGQQNTLASFNMNNSTVNTTIQRLVGEPAPTYEITSIATNNNNGSVTTIDAYMYVGNPIFNNAMASDGDIDIGKDSSVDGDIYYDGTFTYGTNFVHNGDETNGGLNFPTAAENNNFAAKFKAEAIAGGTYVGNYSIAKGDGVTSTLLGPLYITGDLTVAKDNIIDFQGTIYVEGSIDIDYDSEFTGDGSIIAVGSIGVSKTTDYGMNGDSVIMSINSNITFKKEATVEALIYAPVGTVSFDKDTTVTGSIVGGNIVVDKNASISFNANPSVEVPGGRMHIRRWKIN